MKDSQILSTFQELAPAREASAAAPAPPAASPVFDACHVGVVLRAVLFVESAVVVAALFHARSPAEWAAQFAMLTGGAFPAVLCWLVAACALGRWMTRLGLPVQVALGVALGALAGLYGCGLLVLTGFVTDARWTASAAAGALLAAVLLAVLVLRARARAPAAAAARLAELQARIRPHFLFNTLNSAIALVRAEPRRAEAMLEDLSELFRAALADPGDAVTLADELALAERYLAIEQMRFGSRLRLDWQLDAAAGTARLPHLLLQPLVENAVRHGVEPSTTGGEVRIRTERRGDRVVVKVTNTVEAGARSLPGHGLAMDNVRSRLALLHDVQASFRHAMVDGVYQVRIEVPAT